MLKVLAGVAGKVAASLAVITFFLYVSAKLPFFRGDSPRLMTVMPMDSGIAALRGDPSLGDISFASSGDRFEGNFYGVAGDAGFELVERDVPGACEGAGKRYLDMACPDCMVSEVEADPQQPPTLFYLRPNGEVGTIFRDCSERLSDILVRVPQLSFADGTLALGSDAGDGSKSFPVPLLERANRVSSMTLGGWAIAVDSVERQAGALAAMGQLLRGAGWQEASQGDVAERVENQRVYTRIKGQQSVLCVVTLNIADDGFQLVTMMNI